MNNTENNELGESGSDRLQDFVRLKSECLERGELFEDPEFPATDSSLFFSQQTSLCCKLKSDNPLEWKRPKEICDNPQLFVEGSSRFDACQGKLGDCWLVAAIANLTLQPDLFYKVVPQDQSFQKDYAGIFHFRFWQYGHWVEVIIDDRLPTLKGKLVFLHSSENNEFWSALLEKAYAKLHGSYDALFAGNSSDAMVDFTGGVSERYTIAEEIKRNPSNLFSIMFKAYERSSLMSCGLEADPNVPEARTDVGLVKGHSYSITGVKYLTTEQKIPLLRLRNPWGNEVEWTGAWSDKSAEWKSIPEDKKDELGLTFKDEGEFWMSYSDFLKYFSYVEICNLCPDSLTEEGKVSKKWELGVFEGEWVKGVTAGGCRDHFNTFWRNPQYTITLSKVDEDDRDKCTFIVSIMQKSKRSQSRNLHIGFTMFKLFNPENLSEPLSKDYFMYNDPVAGSPNFANSREVTTRCKLRPGMYVIIPSTLEPNEEGEFILRVFSEKPNDIRDIEGKGSRKQ